MKQRIFFIIYIFIGINTIGICDNMQNIKIKEKIHSYAKRIKVCSIRTTVKHCSLTRKGMLYGQIKPKTEKEIKTYNAVSDFLSLLKDIDIWSQKNSINELKNISYKLSAKEQTIVLLILMNANHYDHIEYISFFLKNQSIFQSQANLLREGDSRLRIASFDFDDLYSEKNISQLVSEYLNLWISPLGYSGYNEKDFNKYWEERKDLKSFTGWYYVRLIRSRDIETGKPREKVIEKILEDINKLSEPLLTYTLTSIIAESEFIGEHSDFNKILPTEKDLIEKLNNINKEELKNIFIKEAFCNDPDLKASGSNSFYRTLIRFVYKNKKEFFSSKEIEYINKNCNVYAKDIIKSEK